jgi:hypothetical protein
VVTLRPPLEKVIADRREEFVESMLGLGLQEYVHTGIEES